MNLHKGTPPQERKGIEMRKASAMKLARVTRGLTQSELGQKIGRGQAMVSNFESGSVRASARDKKKIAKILKTSVDALFG